MIDCWSFRFRVGTFRLGKTFEWSRSRRGKSLRMVECSFGMKDAFKKVGCNEGSGMNSESCEFHGGSSW